MKIHSRNPEQTQKVAWEIVTTPQASDILLLNVELGAGKTTLVQHLAQAFEISETVISPTYVIMKSYDLDASQEPFTTFLHLDAYRIENIDEMRVLGFSELLKQKNTIMCIEWPEKIAELILDNVIAIEIEITDTGRRLIINAKNNQEKNR